jgi:DeoR family fructose operon transcriptional repressor
MFGEERKVEIVNLLNTQGNVKVSELAKNYNVSEVTIRKDLQELEEEGLVKRVHGGAVLAHNAKFEPTFSEKASKLTDEKIAIGKLAASMIEDGDTIAIDAGTTTLQLAKYITARNLTVITNSLDIAIELADRQSIEVIVIGGSLRSETRALVGPVADMVLENLVVDKAFVGANGVSAVCGITTPNIVEANTKKQIINSSKKAIILSDHTKFELISFAKIVDTNSVHCIITDYNLEEEIKKDFEVKGVKIITAKEDTN